jgi:hypothetical protein
MLRNASGKPYQVVGNLQQFDPENPEHDLFNLWDEEIIKIGGAPIEYYEVIISFSSIDDLYHEARSKLFSHIPIQLWGYYEPVPAQNYQNSFGIDSPEEMIFEFNYRSVLKSIGHPPKIGSRLYTPHKRENWVIIQRNLGEWKMWGEIRLQLLCQKFQETVTTGEGVVTQPKPDFTIN